MAAAPYDTAFFLQHRSPGLRSAEAVVPFLLSTLRPGSVLDVGCGDAAWLSVFRANGVEDTVGIDGEYVDLAQILIPAEQFVRHDLTKPFALNRKFDLVCSMEVAEHLPETSADSFVDCLTAHGDVVFFSAAIPDQGGVYHINEQWQDYWARKFRDRGYQAIDLVRPRVWCDPSVAFYYKQNAVLYAKPEKVAEFGLEPVEGDLGILSRVHPDLFSMHMHRWSHPSMKFLLKSFPPTARRYVNKVLRRKGSEG
jgi:SAM-dependent methyltransferase